MAKVFLLSSEAISRDAILAVHSAFQHIPSNRHSYAGLSLGGSNPFKFPSARFESWWNLRAWRSVRNAIRDFAPDIIHCFGKSALRIAAGLRTKSQHIVQSGIGAVELDRFTRRLARGSRAIAHSHWEANSMRELGFHAIHVPLGIDQSNVKHTELQSSTQVILFGGTLDAASHPIPAAWAFDGLKYAFPTAQLVFLGDGPLRSRVRQFSYALGFDDYRIRFAAEEERCDWERKTDVVWITQPANGGWQALSALAKGIPVIAMHTPELAEYASDGLTLVPAGDRIALAMATKKHWDRPRTAIPAPRFPLGAMVEGYAAVYDALVGAA